MPARGRKYSSQDVSILTLSRTVVSWQKARHTPPQIMPQEMPIRAEVMQFSAALAFLFIIKKYSQGKMFVGKLEE